MGRFGPTLATGAAALAILAWGPARAQPDPTQALEGTIELAGGTHGCVKLDHRSYVIKYGDRHFHYPPSVEVDASTDDDNISLAVNTGAISRNAAQIVVTAYGPNGHQVCSPAQVNWVLTSNDDN
jgi:hypothetical protein